MMFVELNLFTIITVWLSKLVAFIWNVNVDLSPEFISATVVGEHGNSQIPLWDEVKIANISMNEFCKVENLQFNDAIKYEMAKKVLNMGTEIIKGKGKTYYVVFQRVFVILRMLF